MNNQNEESKFLKDKENNINNNFDNNNSDAIQLQEHKENKLSNNDNINNSNQKKTQNKNQNDKRTIIFNIIIISIFLIFLTIFTINYFMNKITMNRFFYLLDNNYIKPSLQPIPNTKYSKNLLNEKKICSKNKKFAILRRTNCRACGLFSYYIVHLGCIINFLKHGYIPILEVGSFSNVFTGRFHGENNPWEELFYQPCNFTFSEVVKKKDVKIFDCECVDDMPDEKTIYSKPIMLDYHHQIQQKYMGIKNEILKEVKIIWKNLFNNSKNILGILMRGTDYTSIKPWGHSKPPSIKKALNDVENYDTKYKYDYLFIATEDNKIRKKFIDKFGNNKLKYILPEKEVNYNYQFKNYLTYNYKVFGNMSFMKTYLINMIILSKCLDIITSRTSGAAGAFILSKGFRNSLVYYLGEY